MSGERIVISPGTVDEVWSNNTVLAELRYECDGGASIEIGDLTMLVGPSGAGKTSFLKRYFANEKTILVEDYSRLEWYGVLIPLQKDYEKNIALQEFGSAVYRRFGSLVRFRPQGDGKKVFFSSDDNFNDIDSCEITKDELKDRDLIGGMRSGGELYLDDAWLLRQVELCNLVPEVFTLKWISENYKDLVVALLQDVGAFKGSLTRGLSLRDVPSRLTSLRKATVINSDYGFAESEAVKAFDQTSKNNELNWKFKYRDQEHINHTSEGGESNVVIRVLSYCLPGSKEYSFAQLSETQMFQLISIAEEVMLSLSGGASDTLLLLDEPDAHLDPGSIKFLHKYLTDRANSYRGVILSTHNLVTFSRLCRDKEVDVLSFRQSPGDSKTVISKITGNSYALRDTYSRLSDGETLHSTDVSIVEGYMSGMHEENIFFFEGKTDVEMFRLVQALVLEYGLFTQPIRKFLRKSVFSHSFDDSGRRQGASTLPSLDGFIDSNVLESYKKNIFIMFDSDEAGVEAAAKILADQDNPRPGRWLNYADRKYYYCLQTPKAINRKELPGFKGAVLEHLLYHMREELGLNFDDNTLAPKKKTKVVKKLKKYLKSENTSKANKEDCLKEFRLIFTRLVRELSNAAAVANLDSE